MESYNSMCYEKFIVDLEIIGIVKRFCKGVTINSDTLAVDVINELGIAGEFLTTEHTMNHCRKEPLTPDISLRGAVTGDLDGVLLDNIRKKKDKMLASYRKPEMTEDMHNRLVSYLVSCGFDTNMIESI